MEFERYYLDLFEMLNRCSKKIASGKYDQADSDHLFELSKKGRYPGILSELAESFGMEKPEGALVAKVLADSPAEEAGFQVGNAMARNKYIYCLADYGLVVRSDEGKGGTWSDWSEARTFNVEPMNTDPANP